MPPESKQLERICESNSLACSGIIPCAKCYQLVTRGVIPGAMRAGGFSKDAAQAGAFLKAYVEGWKKLLEDKVVQRKTNSPSSFVPTPELLAFFAFREATRAKESLPAFGGTSPVESESTSTKAEVVPTEPGSTKPKKKGSKLLRGDLKRMVEKQTKEPLANGTGSGIRQDQTSTNKDPGASRDEEKH